MAKRYYDTVEEFVKNSIESRGLEEFLYDFDLEPWEAAMLLYDHGLIDVDPDEENDGQEEEL